MKIICRCGEELDFSKKEGKIEDEGSKIELGVDLDSESLFIHCHNCDECIELQGFMEEE